jgi:hypothetical protein
MALLQSGCGESDRKLEPGEPSASTLAPELDRTVGNDADRERGVPVHGQGAVLAGWPDLTLQQAIVPVRVALPEAPAVAIITDDRSSAPRAMSREDLSTTARLGVAF